ncbi:hypothetical protein [Nitrosomonas sp. Nm33]|uniref:hypothetical protein n=1 Tax=Nitrosomonas sp. Nm33 TaxID=133724 RepID=UPI0008961F5D|nr:hypothetical protein [Nitrosomonas sp. Nm33]SDY52534.1 hypothetical protein SAMN05421755_102734 [Nitrosomonas sp. Nm33]
MTKSTGTGRILHEMSAYTNLENEYDTSVANIVTAKAINEARKDAHVTPHDVGSWAKINDIVSRGGVDIEKEKQKLNEQAKEAADQILAKISKTSETEGQGDVDIEKEKQKIF